MLTAQEAFKVGFLARCASAGLPPERIAEAAKQAGDYLEKQANMLTSLPGQALDLAKDVGGGIWGYGMPAALIAPPVLGGLAGYGLARTTDIDDTDVAEIKDTEVSDELKRQSAKLRRQRAIRDYQRARTRTGRVFM